METPSRNLSWSPILVNVQLTLMHMESPLLGTLELVEVQYRNKIRRIKRMASNQSKEYP